MAKPKGIQISGDEELARALAGAQERVKDMEAIHKELGAALLSRARGEAPVLGGALSASLYPAVGPKAYGVGSALIYAAPIHFGWPAHNIEANPFLIRARDAMASEGVKGYERYLQGVVEEVGRKSEH